MWFLVETIFVVGVAHVLISAIGKALLNINANRSIPLPGLNKGRENHIS